MKDIIKGFRENRAQRVYGVFVLLVVVIISGFLFFEAQDQSESKDTSNVVENSEAEASVVLNENITIRAEVADNAFERVQGLSGRENLPEGTGMLFVFESPGNHGIWMKEMNFPIDIIWLDADYRVVFIKSSVSPDTYPTVFEPGEEVSYVLEVNTGVAARAGVKVGDMLDVQTNESL